MPTLTPSTTFRSCNARLWEATQSPSVEALASDPKERPAMLHAAIVSAEVFVLVLAAAGYVAAAYVIVRTVKS